MPTSWAIEAARWLALALGWEVQYTSRVIKSSGADSDGTVTLTKLTVMVRYGHNHLRF